VHKDLLEDVALVVVEAEAKMIKIKLKNKHLSIIILIILVLSIISGFFIIRAHAETPLLVWHTGDEIKITTDSQKTLQQAINDNSLFPQGNIGPQGPQGPQGAQGPSG
jgi:hypothetical protein